MAAFRLGLINPNTTAEDTAAMAGLARAVLTRPRRSWRCTPSAAPSIES